MRGHTFDSTVWDTVWEVVNRVRQHVSGPVVWISQQRIGGVFPEGDDAIFGFAIGGGYSSVKVGELANIDDALIRRCATEILGFPPDSPQDIERRKVEARKHINRLRAEIEERWKQHNYWMAVESRLLGMEVGVPFDSPQPLEQPK